MRYILLLIFPFAQLGASQPNELSKDEWERAIISSEEVFTGEIVSVEISCQHEGKTVSQVKAEEVFNEWLYGSEKRTDSDQPPKPTKKPNPNVYYQYKGKVKIDKVLYSERPLKELVTFTWLEPFIPTRLEDSLVLKDRVTLIECDGEYRLLFWDVKRIERILTKKKSEQIVAGNERKRSPPVLGVSKSITL